MATIIYVDGFNLYYGALKGTPYKWLDLVALSRRLLPDNEIVQVRYFTARIKTRAGNTQDPQRQQTYLRALETLPDICIHLGQYRSHRVRMPLAKPRPGGPRTVEVIKTEEKGSDVNLATYLLLDAFQGRCKTSIVVSNDADLREPIRVAERELGMEVGVVNPYAAVRRSCLEATFHRSLRAAVLEASQLSRCLRDKKGEIHKPAGW